MSNLQININGEHISIESVNCNPRPIIEDTESYNLSLEGYIMGAIKGRDTFNNLSKGEKIKVGITYVLSKILDFLKSIIDYITNFVSATVARAKAKSLMKRFAQLQNVSQLDKNVKISTRYTYDRYKLVMTAIEKVSLRDGIVDKIIKNVTGVKEGYGTYLVKLLGLKEEDSEILNDIVVRDPEAVNCWDLANCDGNFVKFLGNTFKGTLKTFNDAIKLRNLCATTAKTVRSMLDKKDPKNQGTIKAITAYIKIVNSCVKVTVGYTFARLHAIEALFPPK